MLPRASGDRGERGGPLLSDRKLNIGMVGAGFIGQIAHLANFAQLKNCRLAAVAEMRPELRRRVVERYGIARSYAHHRDMLRDPDVEAVVIVTPRAHTGPVALDCLEAGKHVLTEKPMAGTVEGGERLVAAAAAKKVNYAIGYMKRYDEGVQKAKELIHDALATGKLGALQFVRAHCFMGNSYCKADGHVVTEEKPEYSDTGWSMTPAWLPEARRREYEAYVNTYCHNVNLLRFLLGRSPVVEHANFASAGQIAILDFGSFRASLETGAVSNRGWDEVVEIYFDHGKLTLKTPPALLKNVPASVELYSAGGFQEIRSPQIDWTWAFRRQAAAFVDDILAGRESGSSGADSLEDLRLVEGMWRLELRRAAT